MNANSFLCVHQSSELYGSDRVFLDSVRAIRKKHLKAKIEVLLPSHGPLEELLNEYVDRVFYGPLVVLRKSDISSLSNFVKFVYRLKNVFETVKIIRSFDCVYINTIVPINFILAGFFSKSFRTTKVITHVHELVDSRFSRFFGALILSGSDRVICNSYASAKAFNLQNSLRTSIIWNGTAIPQRRIPPMDTGRAGVNILMPGRLNAWKGQDLLLEACCLLDTVSLNMNIRIVGDVANGQEQLREDLENFVKLNGLQRTVLFMGFVDDMASQYKWADLVIIPSKLPEPFGMVAIEAMSNEKPVIAANHGGLCEIIQDGVTGWLFMPGDENELALKLSTACEDKKRLQDFGKKGFQRVTKLFSLETYEDNFIKLLDKT